MNFIICTIIKNENLYLREWIKYHLNLGFDKIIIYDNNDIEGENPNTVIQDYIDKNQVEVLDFRGKKTIENFWNIQTCAYNDCLSKYKNTDSWIAFLDIDEFLELEKYTKIQYVFENNPAYNNFDTILLNWLNYGDSGKLYYENEPVLKRFTVPAKDFIYADNLNYNMLVKPITKPTDATIFNDGNAHCPSFNACNVAGEKCAINNSCNKLYASIHSIMYIKHFYTKSLTEFMNRKILYKDYFNISMELYKSGNNWSEEHEKVYQNFLKQNNITL